MHEFLEYPEKDLTVPTPSQVKKYTEKSPTAIGPGLNPLVLDLASKGSSNWNKKAAKLFEEEFRSLGISECDDKDPIETMFLTHVDYLRKLYVKQRLDVEGKVDATERARQKARYSRRREVNFMNPPTKNSIHYIAAQGTTVQECTSSISTHFPNEGNPCNTVDFPR